MKKDDWVSKLYLQNIIDEKGVLSPEDYTIEKGLLVFTESFHIKRGHCCNKDCKNCPYKKEIKD